jgi:hypothetical protein
MWHRKTPRNWCCHGQFLISGQQAMQESWFAPWHTGAETIYARLHTAGDAQVCTKKSPKAKKEPTRAVTKRSPPKRQNEQAPKRSAKAGNTKNRNK